MANRSDSSRQRRARENRARRAALEARTKGAPPARPSRVAPSTAEKLKARSSEPRTAAGQGGDDAATVTEEGRPKRERRPRPGDRPVDLATLEGSWFSKVTQVPGGTQALFAGVMAVVATGLMSLTKSFVAEEDLGREGAEATQTIFGAYDLGEALALVLIPLAVALGAAASTLHPRHRRIWLFAAVFLGLVAATRLQFYLFVAGFLAYAVFRAARVEGPAEPLLKFGRRRAAATPADDDTGDAPA